ncbi:hypothetical protein C0W42_20740 [Photobacterium kishitanii]|uniref:hypothetical protein n=1 Tax=Photobacterium kishitanii TaxID=318456 RepID=UPI000D178872|nr:hypothetical protein [Photobacterium kishitanii]PSU86431.1 hypothetical protein C0W42_20740 [Photobacterium kishitanii]
MFNTNITQNDELNDDSSTVISIPVNKRDLGNFIGNLLGQKQSLERTYDIYFEIDHSWLINLHEMIDQRISQQANSHLVNFTAVVYFDGGMKRTITTIESFRAYHETKPEVSIGIKIVWEYLVQFPKRTHPEKQQISFTASVYDHKQESNNHNSFFERFLFNKKESLINIQIDHTERTWGDDIENIISSCILENTSESSVIDITMQIFRIAMTFFIFAFMVVYPNYNSISLSNDSLYILNNEYLELMKIENNNINSVSEKIDIIFNTLSTIEESKNVGKLWQIISSITGPIIAALFLVFTKPSKQSYILLSSKSRQLKSKNEKQSKIKITIIIVTYIGSIIAGIIGNYGFTMLNS